MLADLVPTLKRLHWKPERGTRDKRCAGPCRSVKNLNEFNWRTRGGYQAYCKVCENAMKKDKYNPRRGSR